MADLSEDKRTLLEERFELLEFLGSGGFGRVYRARDARRDGAEVAVKVLTRVGPRALSQFKDEFRAVRQIVHDSLVTYYELGSLEDLWFITMEYIDGVDVLEYVMPDGRDALDESVSGVAGADWTTVPETAVTEKIESWEQDHPDAVPEGEEPTARMPDQSSPSPLPDLDRLREVLIQISHGLKVLHDADKLHCDLKPSNILVDERGEVAILDFGMVRDLMGPAGETDAWSSPVNSPDESVFVGTPHYASPEHVRGSWLDEASDWYSIGVLLYRMLTGRFPIEGSSESEILARKQLFDPLDLREIRDDIPPSLGRLCMDLLAREPEARPRAPEIFRRLDAPLSGVRAVDGGRAEVPDHFVGRTREFNTLSTVVDEAADHRRAGLVEVTGPSGIGKSALCRHFLWHVRRRHPDAVLLRGACHDDESVPFKALDGIVDRLVDWLDRKSRPRPSLSDQDFRSLTQLFPVVERLADESDGQDASIDPALRSATEMRRRAVDALRRLFETMTRDGPAILFIDDVQWGDADSAQLISRLLADPAPPIVVIMTSRSTPDHRGPFLETIDSLEARLDPELRRERLPLDPLEPSRATALAEALLETDADTEALAERIATESEGQPFLIAEMARWANHHGPPGHMPGDAGTLEASLDAILADRIQEIPADARRLLEVLAVAGRPTAPSIAAEVARLDAGNLQTAETRLRTARLVRRLPGGDERELLETYHDRVRETTVDGLPDGRRHGIHEALFDALRDADAPPERLVEHLVGAGDVEAAASYALEAAERARRTYAYGRAAELYGKALDYREWSRDERCSLLRRRAEMLSGIGRNRDAAEPYRRARDLADGFERLELQYEYGNQLARSGRLDEGVPLLVETLRDLGVSIPSPDSRWLTVKFFWHRFRLMWRGFDYEIQPESELSDREYLTLEALGTLAGAVGAMDLSLSTYCQHVFCYRALEAGAPGALAGALCLQSNQEMIREATRDRARRMLEEAESLIEHSERAGELWPVYAFQVGMMHYYSGEFEKADQWYHRALEWLPMESEQADWERDTYRLFAIFPNHWLGRFDEFARDFDDMLERARSVGNRFHESAVLAWSYVDHLVDDAPDRALETLDRADQRWEAPNYHSVDMWVLQGRVETRLYRGEPEAALELVRADAAPLRRSLMLHVEVMKVTFEYLRGRALVAVAADASGLRQWWLLFKAERAARRIAAVSAEFLSAFAHPLRARIADLEGRTDEAIDHLREAEGIFERYDIRFYAAAMRRRRGELTDGERGREITAEADARIRDCGIEAPAAMARMANASVGSNASRPRKLTS